MTKTAMIKGTIVACVLMGLIMWRPTESGAMTLGTHFVVGAGLAYTLADNEWEALALGLASHVLLDAIPHNDETVEIPVMSTLAAVLFTYRLMQQEGVDWGIVGAGGVGGLLPDAEHALKHAGIIKRSYFPSHDGLIRQPKVEMGTALWIEFGLSSLAFGVSF